MSNVTRNNGKYVRVAGTLPSDDEQEINASTGRVVKNITASPRTGNSEIPDDTAGSDESADEAANDGSVQSGDAASDGSDNDGSEKGDTDSPDDPLTSPPYSSRSPSVPSSPEVAYRQGPSPDEIERANNAARIDRMEKVLDSINAALDRFKENTGPQQKNDIDTSWRISNDTNVKGNGGFSASIRWDHLKSFPSGIPSNKLWEEWNRYLETFEIAASLNNVNDPAKRAQLLFLSVGDTMQGIIKAAKLQPKLTDPSCYTTFVTNVQNYLSSMTDKAAEHEVFTRMRQEDDESAVAYHARLMCKVRSCKYSADDEDRFVRAQLLNGLRNKDLVRQAKIFGYETSFIVQSATRDEAFRSEHSQHDEASVFEVRNARQLPSRDQGKRKYAAKNGGPPRGPPTKQNRRAEANQPSKGRRCQGCFLFRHRYGRCPAIGRSCNACGELGHFEAACEQKRVNMVQDGRNSNVTKFKDDDRYREV